MNSRLRLQKNKKKKKQFIAEQQALRFLLASSIIYILMFFSKTKIPLVEHVHTYILIRMYGLLKWISFLLNLRVNSHFMKWYTATVEIIRLPTTCKT